MKVSRPKPADDRWVPTICYMCYSHCSVKAQRVNGTVVEIAGDPDSPHSQGKVCAKGRAGIMGLYDPYRPTRPLRRTNPEKGIGVDPKWQEITWEEALDTVVEKLKQVKEEDPRGLLDLGHDFQMAVCRSVFASAFGTPNHVVGTPGYFCGPALHLVHYLVEGAFQVEPDFDYCNYLLMVGGQEGFMVSLNSVPLAGKMAEARSRGMRVVVVDPMCGVAAAKANEWIAIRPGTDAAFALGLLNVLLNELGIYDQPFLKRYTNGPYLVGEDGYYMRERESGKPLVWDSQEGQARPYDARVKDVALEGSFELEGRSCFPAFGLFKEHVKSYKPEEVARITTVPADTLRRVAHEFGEAARIGSRIVIDGMEFPLRPVACIWRRGAGAHKHGGMAGLALEMINAVVGAIDVPGGLLGNRTMMPFGGPKEGVDGILIPSDFALTEHRPYPARNAQVPEGMAMLDLFPVAYGAQPSFEEGVLNPSKYGLDYRPKLLLHMHSNVLMTASSPRRMAQVLKAVPFMVSFSTYLTETTEFADIVFPDTHYLERLIPFPNSRTNGYTLGTGYWYWPLQQPVVEPINGARSWTEVLLDIVHRLGIGRDFYVMFNSTLRLKGEYKLDPEKEHSWEEVVDSWARSWFGPEHGLSWFKEHGLYKKEKKTKDRYPRTFMTPRLPIYFEQFKRAGEELKQVTDKLDLAWDISDYRPLPDWLPCDAHEERRSEYDLFVINYKLPFHTFSITPENPWLNELAQHHPYAYKIMINTEVARRKGIGDGEIIWVESTEGKVKGQAKPTEMVHPEVVAIAGAFGNWAKGMPVARGQGVHFNTLLPAGLDQVDKLCAALDCCAKVKIYRA